jgi:hypothetical protein
LFAEFETNPRGERQLEGIKKAKAAGVYKGAASVDRRDQGPGIEDQGPSLDFSNISVHRGRESEKDVVLQ